MSHIWAVHYQRNITSSLDFWTAFGAVHVSPLITVPELAFVVVSFVNNVSAYNSGKKYFSFTIIEVVMLALTLTYTRINATIRAK